MSVSLWNKPFNQIKVSVKYFHEITASSNLTHILLSSIVMTIAGGVGRENIYKCFLSLLSWLFHSVQELHLPNPIKFNLWLTSKPKSWKLRNAKGHPIITFPRCYVLILKKAFLKSSHQRCPIKRRCFSESLAQVLSCEFCEISKNNFFTKHLWTAASVSPTFCPLLYLYEKI